MGSWARGQANRVNITVVSSTCARIDGIFTS
jgi:hypothetical protein